MSTFLNSLFWRRSVKRFGDYISKKPSIDGVLKAISESPSSAGIQPYKVLVVTEQFTKEQLFQESNNVQIKQCSHLLVFCIRTDTIQLTEEYIKDVSLPEIVANRYRSRAVTLGEDFSTNQLYLSLGFALAAAAELRIASCPMEGFSEEVCNRVLKLQEKNLKVKCLLALGNESTDPSAVPYHRYRSGRVIVHL